MTTPMPARSVHRIVAAASVSSVGDGLAAIALPLFATVLTRDARLVTGLYAVELIPWLLIGSRVGQRVDRGARPARTMVKADLVRGLGLGGVAFAVATGSANLVLLYLCAALIGVGFVVHSASASSLLADLAEGDQLARANGWLYAVEAAGVALVGPAIGGVLFAFSRSLPFAVDAVSFGLSALVLAGWWRRVGRPSTEAASIRERMAAKVVGHQLLRPLYVVAVSIALMQALVLSSVVLFATRRLGLSPRGFGVFMAFTALGNIVAGLVTPRLWRDRRRTRAMLLGALGVLGVSYLVLAATRNSGLACASLVAEAYAIGVLGTISPTLRLENAGGRAGGVATFFRQGAYTAHAVGGVAAGFMVTQFGFATTYTIAGLGALTMLAFVPSIARQVTSPRGAADELSEHDRPEHDPFVTPLGLLTAAHSIEHDDAAEATPIRWDPPLVSDRHGW